VYNLHIDRYHSYFADGIYVHNDKGGERSDFVDTAVFVSGRTDKNGHLDLDFELPDNITSWRITAIAISDDYYVGIENENLEVSKSLFADAILLPEYLTSDVPGMSYRAYGDGVSSGDEVSFTIGFDDETLNNPRDVKNVFERYDLAVPMFTQEVINDAEVRIGVKNDEYEDVLVRKIDVVDSRIVSLKNSTYALTPDLNVDHGESGTTLVIADSTLSLLHSGIGRLKYSNLERVDAKLARVVARDMNDSVLGGDDYSDDDVDFSEYQADDGGVSLLPYSSSDLVLSAKVASLDSSRFDKNRMRAYFSTFISDEDVDRGDEFVALWGLAELGDPVLAPLQAAMNEEDLTVNERLYVGLGLDAIGDSENARAMFADVVTEYGENFDSYTRIKMDTDDEMYETSALAMMLGSSLSDEYTFGLWKFVFEIWSKERTVPLEEAVALLNIASTYAPNDVSFTITVNGKSENISLNDGNVYTRELNVSQLGSLEFSEISGDIGVVSEYRDSSVDTSVDSQYVDVRREYYVDGVMTNEFNVGNIVEVRFYPEFDDQALKGQYQVTDYMPSTMTVANIRSPHAGRNARRPYLSHDNGQVVSFTLRSDRNENIPYYYYTARVVSPGTYTAEPASISSVKAPSVISWSQAGSVSVN